MLLFAVLLSVAFGRLQVTIRHVIQNMPAAIDIEQRNRALTAFTILTGARDGVIASFKLRHIHAADDKIDQDAREARTKLSKSFVTIFSALLRDAGRRDRTSDRLSESGD